ncbi:phage holin [Halobacillus karajensis]|uniref:Holin, SPP1 family n=1 Tax=Halobacillus karajensis TaxID=195088 RepID=A0A059NXQ3_9BACI|nr:phage holin [Halobacillus karajensis]CDQ22561.1 holin, SPP1 family [Halobacillus karajensis]CDQ26043.1 holin, SPP1 family [Halobacillus karajensis]
MDRGSLIRTTVLVFALINQVLAAFGKSPLPFSEAEVEQGVSAIITVGASLVAWFKNNYVTEKGAQQARELEKKGLK